MTVATNMILDEFKRVDVVVGSEVWSLSDEESVTTDDLNKTSAIIISTHDGAVLASMIDEQPPAQNSGVLLPAGRSVTRRGKQAANRLCLIRAAATDVNVSVTLMTPTMVS